MKITSPENYREQYQASVTQPDVFWAGQATEYIWRKTWHTVMEGDMDNPDAIKWFEGAQLNITENCIDRYAESDTDKVAVIWEPSSPDMASKQITYKELQENVCRYANLLKKYSVSRGDRVCLYMPMIPEAVYAMLACARIGAIHSVVFAGFSSKALESRINDAECKVVMTADVGYRGEKYIPLYEVTREAVDACPSVKHVLIYSQAGQEDIVDGQRDVVINDQVREMDATCEPEVLDAEDPLFILYTSGSTGKPKGILHTQAGYMVYAGYTFQNVFQCSEDDIHWCAADIGWVTGHTYIVYGPLLSGVTTVMFEGVPAWPNAERYWQVISRHQATTLYTSPTAIRSLQAYGEDIPQKYPLDSLKVVGSVGEPINEAAWHWLYDNVGRQRCPLVDTWWQTETGGIMIAPLAGITELKPSYATMPLPGVSPVILDADNNEITKPDTEGALCIKQIWPGIARGIYGDQERYKEVYFGQHKGCYATGDSAKRDEDGNYRIIGRVDDTINTSGHLIGTAEVESVMNKHESITESAVVGVADVVRGEAICAFVVSQKEVQKNEINEMMREEIGPIVRIEKLIVVSELPKTRSGKIMRRILKKIISGSSEDWGDVSTLVNPDSVEAIVKKVHNKQ